MKTAEKANGAGTARPGGGERTERLAEHNFQLMRWLMDYELRAAERYRRFVTLLLVASSNGCEGLKEAVTRTKRESDKLFELGPELAILMTETDLEGALVAVNRFKALFSEEVDLRFAMVNFPLDGISGPDLIGKVYRRLNAARMMEYGAVVDNG